MNLAFFVIIELRMRGFLPYLICIIMIPFIKAMLIKHTNCLQEGKRGKGLKLGSISPCSLEDCGRIFLFKTRCSKMLKVLRTVGLLECNQSVKSFL